MILIIVLKILFTLFLRRFNKIDLKTSQGIYNSILKDSCFLLSKLAINNVTDIILRTHSVCICVFVVWKLDFFKYKYTLLMATNKNTNI